LIDKFLLNSLGTDSCEVTLEGAHLVGRGREDVLNALSDFNLGPIDEETEAFVSFADSQLMFYFDDGLLDAIHWGPLPAGDAAAPL
jgi:hypothetical protein